MAIQWSQTDAERLTRVNIFEDFLTIDADSRFTKLRGTGAGTVHLWIPPSVRGMGRLTTGADAAGDYSKNGVQAGLIRNLALSLGYVQLRFRIRAVVTTNLSYYSGLTDDTTNFEMPCFASGSANTITPVATDAVGVLWDTAMSSPRWWGVCIKAGVLNAVDLGVAPIDNVLQVFEIEANPANGNVNFFIDGNAVGAIAAGIGTSVILGFTINAFSRSTVNRDIEIDYVLARNTNRV